MKKFLQFIDENCDKKYSEFSSKLCTSSYQIKGVKIPILRGFVKGLTQQEKYFYLDNFNPTCFEEVMLYGIILGSIKCDLNVFVGYFNKFLPYVDNWSVCDSSVATFKIIDKNKDAFLPIIENLLKTNVEFYQRIALVILLDYYITPKYIDRIFSLILSVNTDYFYVKMAIAWLLSVCYVKFKDLTFTFLQNHKLDDFILNKTISKICDSYRVLEQDKLKIKQLRVKKLISLD